MWTWIVANKGKAATVAISVAAASAGVIGWTDAGRAILTALGIGGN